jgi:glycosyltransferase involved in cell wall biosynthesis
LAEGHLLTMPYAYEGFGIALLEAMAFGLPVVGSTLGAARQIIQPGVNGYLVAPDGQPALGRIMEKLDADRRLLARMGLAARQCAMRHPTWSRSMGEAVRFLVHLAESWS